MQSTRKIRRGFTIIELMVVIGIIVLLVALLLPALSGARKRAQITATTAQMGNLQSAIEQYYQVFNAYPGAIPLTQTTGVNGNKISGAQNLALSLSYTMNFGGKNFIPVVDTTSPSVVKIPLSSPPKQLYVDPAKPNGPADLGNTLPPPDAITTVYRAYPPFMNIMPKDITTPDPSQPPNIWATSGVIRSPATGVNAFRFPTFVDRFSDALPILYYRKQVGVDGTGRIDASGVHRIIGSPAVAANASTPYTAGMSTFQNASYFVTENVEYTAAGVFLSSSSGTPYKQTGTLDDKFLTKAAGTGSPPDASGSVTYVSRGGYVLISAGPDHLYGSNDDIVIVGGH